MSCYRNCNATNDSPCTGQVHNSQRICKVCNKHQNRTSSVVAHPVTSLSVAPIPVHLGKKPAPAKKREPNPSVGLVCDHQASGSSDAVPLDTTNPVAIVRHPASQVQTSTGSELAPVDDAHECHVPHDYYVDVEDEDVPQQAATPDSDASEVFVEAYVGLLKQNEAVQCLFFEGNVACITLPDCERSVPVVLQVTVAVVNRFIDWVLRVASLQVDNPRHIYAVPVLFKEQEELQYIMVCDCPASEQYWKDLSGWKPESMTPSGKC
jgi:hypothetical protein